MFDEVFKNIEEIAKQTNAQKEGDFIKDGLLHCGKCLTPKQAMIRQPRIKGIQQGYKPMPILCKCRQQELDAERREREAYERRGYRIKALGKSGASHTFATDDRAEEYATRVSIGYVNCFKEVVNGVKQPTPTDGLLFCGNTGTGKTFLCHAILNAVADKGYSIMAVTVGQFERKVWSGDKGEIFKTIERVDLLLLDDLGAERASPYVQQLVFDLLDTRVSARKPLLITTNLTKEQLMRPDSIENRREISRVLGSVSIIELTGKDRRAENYVTRSKENTSRYYDIGKKIDEQDGVPF